MDPSLVPYQYTPLASGNYFRLIDLLPESHHAISTDAIRCRIFEACTDEQIPYTALSYVWGPKVDPKTIFCSASAYLHVRKNLYDALLRIRHPTETKTLWIDAICINQSDITERNHQVAQMRQIYQRASQLLI